VKTRKQLVIQKIIAPASLTQKADVYRKLRRLHTTPSDLNGYEFICTHSGVSQKTETFGSCEDQVHEFLLLFFRQLKHDGLDKTYIKV